jgi:transcriptional regulator with XRE-family HTH domain
VTLTYRTRREAAGLGAAQLGERAGLGAQVVRKWERGEPVSAPTHARLLHALEAAEAERAGVEDVGAVRRELAEVRAEVAEMRATIAALVADVRRRRAR